MVDIVKAFILARLNILKFPWFILSGYTLPCSYKYLFYLAFFKLDQS